MRRHLAVIVRRCYRQGVCAFSRALVSCVLLLHAGLASAQNTAGVHSVVGTVYDSVVGAPLVGASVHLAILGDAVVPRTATTDTAGRYLFDAVPAGRYVLGFYHDALTAWGLDAPLRVLDVGTTASVTADLAVPSSATIRRLRCGDDADIADGALVGSVRDAESLGALAGAQIAVRWRAFALDSGDYRVVSAGRSGIAATDGSFAICGLPLEAPLDLSVSAPGHRELAGAVLEVPVSGLSRIDLALTDSALTSGRAMVRGRVKYESGKPLATGRVLIETLNRAVPVVDGQFSIADLPAGSWVAQIQAIGVEPREMLVRASERDVDTVALVVRSGAQRLEAVTVVGKMDRNLTVLDDVLRRSRVGTGTTFLPGHPALRSAHFVSDVMREARGFQFMGPTKIRGRAIGSGARCQNVAVYVDDVRQPDGFTVLDQSVRIKDVLAIETWPDIRLAPVQYRRGTEPTRTNAPGSAEPAYPDSRPCALVLVWTQRRF